MSTALKKLELGIQYKLVLIVAPPGTCTAKLLRQWAQDRLGISPIPPLWVKINTEDNSPSQFLSKLISELLIWDPNIQEHVDPIHIYNQIPQDSSSSESNSNRGLHSSIEELFTEIINRLICLEGERFLIMQNYHCISNPEIHTLVAYIIDYLPSNLHLIITSLEYPPLQFPRLRVRRELLEIGPDDMN